MSPPRLGIGVGCVMGYVSRGLGLKVTAFGVSVMVAMWSLLEGGVLLLDRGTTVLFGEVALSSMRNVVGPVGS